MMIKNMQKISINSPLNDFDFMQNFVLNLREFKPQNEALKFKLNKNIALNSRLGMIYAMSARSEIYLNTLLNENIAPSFILFLSEDNNEALKIAKKAQKYGILTHVILSKNINCDEVFDFISNLRQDFIIYSGFGGGILEKRYFDLDKKFIHIHAGKLPKFRGSTTCYYQLLKEGNLGASAMFLNAGLDTGEVLSYVSLKKAEILALKNTDIDTTIEPYARAKALVKALKNYEKTHKFSPKIQNKKGEIYYRIHPVLKHLAIFSVFNEEGL